MFGIEEMTGINIEETVFKGKECKIVLTKEELEASIEDLKSTGEPIALDTETEGLSPLHHHIVSVIMASSPTKAYYYPLRHKIGENLDEVDFRVAFEQLAKERGFILFNSKFDWEMIYSWWGIDFDIAADVQLMAYVHNSDLAESKNLSLKQLEKDILHEEPLEFKVWGVTDFSLVDSNEAWKYAAPDGFNLYALYEYYKPLIKELGLEKVLQIELDCIKGAAMMELNGVYVNPDILNGQKADMEARIYELEQEIYKLAGHEFDIASPQQFATVLYDELGVKPLQKRGEDDRSVGADNLKALQDKHLIVGHMMNYREVMKLYNDFIVKLPNCLGNDQRLHGQLNTTGTRSGRCSASGGFGLDGMEVKVNMQQIPKNKAFTTENVAYVPPHLEDKFDFNQVYDYKTLKNDFPEVLECKQGRELKYEKEVPVMIRKAFEASPGYTWVGSDYSQLEYRCLANMSNEDSLIDAFNKGIDFHTATASAMLGIPIDKVDKHARKKGKTLNFGLVYGMTEFGLAQKLETTPQEAKKLMEQYFINKPNVKALSDHCKKQVLEEGLVRTFTGRIRHFDTQIARARAMDDPRKRDNALEQVGKQAFNTMIQGSGADLSKIALARVYNLCKPFGDKIRLLTMIHDEINIEIHNSLPVELGIAILYYGMSYPANIVPGWAPIPGDVEVGPNFQDKKEIAELGYDLDAIMEEYLPQLIELESQTKYFPSADDRVKADEAIAAKYKNPHSDVNNPTRKRNIQVPSKTEEPKKVSAPKKISVPTISSVSGTTYTMSENSEEKEAPKMDGTQNIPFEEIVTNTPSVMVRLKTGIDAEIAYKCLRDYIANNFGSHTLYIMNDGLIYKFDGQYTVNTDTSSIEDYFDVRISNPKPKIKISL